LFLSDGEGSKEGCDERFDSNHSYVVLEVP
jgi:hypothetical protein